MKQNFQLKPLVIALGLFGAIFPCAIFAEETSEQAKDSDGDVITLADVVVTGANKKATILPKRKVTSIYGTDSSVLDTPRVVSQVSEQQFREDVIRSADDLVKYAPSITRGGGQNANFAAQIRGQNSEVFQDSQRIYSTRHPTNLNAYEAADIVAGPTGVIFAPTSGSGGYINYLTKKPNFNKAQTTISGSVGSIYAGQGAEPNFSVSIDHTAPISKELAFRVSATAQRTDDYYDNVKNNFNAFYGALAWRPDDSLRVDWNISYDDYSDFNVTHGWNRATQQSVDQGLYYKGRATPIIQNGSNFWSPVFESGAAHSKVIGWQTRQKNDKNQYIAVGPVQTSPLPSSTADQAGTIRGWVYDPSIAGNGLVKLDDDVSGRSEDKNSAKRFSTQFKLVKDINENWSVANSTLYQKSRDLGDSVGSFFTDLDHELLDNRLEFLGDHDFELLGVKISNKSSTGGAYRHEKFTSLAANNSFNINPYDLTNDPSQKNPGDLLGLVNHGGSTGSWIGQAGVPQYSQYFGYLNLPRMYPVGHGLYAEKGGFPPNGGGAVYTGTGFWDTYSVFTQQNFTFNDVFGINLGINHSSIKAKLENPLVLVPTDVRSDSNKYSLLSYQASTFIKPTEKSTLYFTYDKSTALNTGVFGPFLIWGAGNQLNPLAFDSQSELKEVGVKYEPITDQLLLTLSGFEQKRDLSPDTNGNMARFEIKGLESSLRWQLQKNIAIGANLTYLNAEYSSIIPAGFSPFGFHADNATVWGDSNALNQRKAGRYDAAGIPKYSASAYVDYQHQSGFGLNLSGWWTSNWYTNLSQTVKVPNNYNLDLGLYYRQPQWTVGLNILNLTNERNFVNGLAGANSEFLQPMRPLTVQGQFSYKF
ncbi:TonB-dependent receptor [Acinetobacter guillouiae]|uniref:TonB-dependent receptor n=1 Tax=Acinetobacter TaxID=469 RepID=UPI00141BB3D1|nr:MULTISPECIES: TonB-dependent receptor plug domain-containing protein [Acinetobacter]MCS4297976.1 outer membrane receptor for monomeric catechols [Acinetobacter guillouiae]MCU4491981.1 TonB-dependent receptor [Acinetobacter guillouiae]MCW2251580.1 outer membrane receptor for monomeric catechols [Acinetobacter sp. BIGb0204]NII35922.1 outer membrane receptor for monomeric catechols [Acinetobacter sp. BIGb0196]